MFYIKDLLGKYLSPTGRNSGEEFPLKEDWGVNFGFEICLRKCGG